MPLAVAVLLVALPQGQPVPLLPASLPCWLPLLLAVVRLLGLLPAQAVLQVLARQVLRPVPLVVLPPPLAMNWPGCLRNSACPAPRARSMSWPRP